MFGHNTNDDQQQAGVTLPQPDGALADTTAPSTPSLTDSNSAGEYIDDAPGNPAASLTQPSHTDFGGAGSSGLGDDDLINSDPAPNAVASGQPDTDQLLAIKQHALQQLTPLVGHLEQSAEEKFRTTMMMIQASDNHALVQTAYEAAQQITDEKARAQALLDIVNEINYFTHRSNSEAA